MSDRNKRIYEHKEETPKNRRNNKNWENYGTTIPGLPRKRKKHSRPTLC